MNSDKISLAVKPAKKSVRDTRFLFSEVFFFSIQGEGEYTGVPTSWLRFFGCPLTCSGFGQKDPTDPSTYVLPYEDLDLEREGIERMTDLPVFKYGCDSSYSWAAKFKALQEQATPQEISRLIRDKMTNGFNPTGSFRGGHMCFTGGEPLLRKAQQCSADLVKIWHEEGDYPTSVTFETNTTQPLIREFVDFWSNRELTEKTELFFSCSPKLFSVSGEPAKKAIKPHIASSYNQLSPRGQLKFVVDGTERCWDELESVLEQFRAEGVTYPVWCMPVGATKEDQEEVAGTIATQIIERGYNVAARVHAHLWKNVIGV